MDFVKCIFLLLEILILRCQSIDTMNYTDLFLCVKPTLYSHNNLFLGDDKMTFKYIIEFNLLKFY